MDRNSDKNRSLLICLTLILTTIAVFYQVYTYDFVNYDDPTYVYQNPNIQAGITFKAVKWAFTTGRAANWHPLTWFSHMLDWQLFGSNPAGHHITNLAFHVANTLLLFIVLKRMTHSLWPSAFAAALFALHPLHIESVVRVSERKDVLSAFFWMLTMWAYARFVNQPKTIRYLPVIVFFALGLISKPMLITLPFVLLLLDYWPLERIRPKGGKAGPKYSLVYLLIEKIPLFAMSLASCVVTFIVQKKGGAVHTIGNCSLPVRLANASISYVQYIGKMIWPARLAFFYPHPSRNVSFFYAVISAVLLLIVTILVLRFAKERRYLFTGWFWYLGTLVPVIGLVQVGSQAMADRYSYITLTGLFIIIAWGLSDLLAKRRYKKTMATSLALLIVLAMSICTCFQLRHWRNSQTLFQHALDVTEHNYMAHFCVAGPLQEQGRLDEAIYHYSEALRIVPNWPEALNSLGCIFQKAGRIDEAIYYYRKALEVNPSFGNAHLNLSNALIAKGERVEAIEHLEELLRLEPSHAKAMNNLAWFLATSGKTATHNPDKAVKLAQRACELTNYKDPGIVDTLAVAFAAAGRFSQAIETAEKALELCRSPEQNALKEEIKNRLVLYKAGKPYIEGR